jgi:NAD(P)-dependent dehydrogenase (short-subunit alcohol dehydrogenase family)
MRGKAILIPGATSRLGLATAILLAERGAEVVMVGRDRARANFMRMEATKDAAGSAPILLLADLSSQAEIHVLAQRLHRSFSRIAMELIDYIHMREYVQAGTYVRLEGRWIEFDPG